jgi:mono/diheme cytochrome c family protein
MSKRLELLALVRRIAQFQFDASFLSLLAVTSLLTTSMWFSGCDSQGKVSLETLGRQTDSVIAGLPDNPQIQQGYQVYRDYGCILCHGVKGEKGRLNANAQTGGEIPSLTYVAEGFTVEEFQRKVMDGVLRVQRKDSAGPNPPWRMPGWRGAMTRTELDDLTAFTWSLLPKKNEDEF